MAIVNRDLDASQQRDTVNCQLGAVATGLTLSLYVASSAVEVQAVRVSALGLSGAPTGRCFIQRFLSTGGTGIAGGWTALTVAAVGTSGIQTMVSAAAGSTNIQLAQGDVLMYTSGGSNAALADATVAVVVKNLVDIKNQFNAF